MRTILNPNFVSEVYGLQSREVILTDPSKHIQWNLDKTSLSITKPRYRSLGFVISRFP